MVRLLLFFCTLLLIPTLSQGQVSISVDPQTFVLTGHPTQTDIPYHIQVTNTSNETLNLHWSKRMTNNPVSWLSWVCDKTTCYDPSFNANPASKPNVLAPGEAMDLQIHMNPVLVEGSADYEIHLLDGSGNLLTTITGTFLINNTTAVKETNDLKLTVFPNPTADFFEVSETAGLRYVQIFNITGNKVRAFDAAPQKQYYVGDLADGIYLVRLISSSNKVLKTVRLSKR